MVYPDEQGDLEHKIFAINLLKNYVRGSCFSARQMNLRGHLGSIKPCDICDAWKTVLIFEKSIL